MKKYTFPYKPNICRYLAYVFQNILENSKISKPFLLFLLTSLSSLTIYSQIVGTPSSQNVCNGSNTADIIFSGGPSGGNGNTGDYWITIYPWTGNLVSIGGASNSGTGNISPFLATNLTAFPITVTITVSPITNYHHNWVQYVSVPQTPFQVSITVYPTPTAPVISPSPASACSGTNIALTASGAGGGENYRWYDVISGGTPLFTGSPFFTPTIALGTTTYYASIINSNGCEGNRTAVAVTGTSSPVIITQPVSSTVCTSSPNTSFSLLASGSALSYQWEVYPTPAGPWTTVTNGGIYSGALTNTLNITGATIGMTGYQYRCVVTTAACSVTSDPVTLSVTSAPSITTQPTNQTVCMGTPAIFTVQATGAIFQWQMSPTIAGVWVNVTNAGVYNGATTNTLTIATPNLNNPPRNYYFRVVVSIPGCGSITSSNARLSILQVPSFTLQPVSTSVCQNGQVQFSVTNNPAAVTRIWQVSTDNGVTWSTLVNGTPYSGATGAVLTINPVSAGMTSFQYRCVATIPSGLSCNSASDAAILTVNSLPQITLQPTSQVVCNGASTSFTVTATGTPPLAYQWQLNGTNIPGATSNTYSINPVGSGDIGNYTVVVSNGCGSLTSLVATLSLPAAITAGHNTTLLTECAGFNPNQLDLNNPAISGGISPYSYQWLLNGSIIAGATSSTYDPPQLNVAGTYNYSCEITDACGTTFVTAQKDIIIVPDPTVSISGAGTACQNSLITLTAIISGGIGTFNYQWQSSTSAVGPWNSIIGATVSTYSPPTTVNGTIFYQVIVNANGSGCNDPICNPVSVSVISIPTPTLTPISPCEGTNPEFTAGGGSIYEFLIDGIIQQAASSDNTFQPATALTAGSSVCVRSLSPFVFNGALSESSWGAPLATSNGGPDPSGFGAGNNIDAIYLQSVQDFLFGGIAGNLINESGNKILLFIDCLPGGYNTLSGWASRDQSPNYSVRNLNGGIIFDNGFEPDVILSINQAFGDVYYDLYSMHTNVNNYLGSAGTSAMLGFAPNSGPGDYLQGFEFAIPRTAIGSPAGNIQVFAMIVNDPGEFGTTFISNQFLAKANSWEGNYDSGSVDFSLATPNPVSVALTDEDCYSETCITVQPLPATSSIFHY